VNNELIFSVNLVQHINKSVSLTVSGEALSDCRDWQSSCRDFSFISYGCSFLSPAVFDIWGSKRIGSRVWPFGVTWRHRSRDHSIRHTLLPIDGPLELHVIVSISNDFRDIQWRIWRNGWHVLKLYIRCYLRILDIPSPSIATQFFGQEMAKCISLDRSGKAGESLSMPDKAEAHIQPLPEPRTCYHFSYT